MWASYSTYRLVRQLTDVDPRCCASVKVRITSNAQCFIDEDLYIEKPILYVIKKINYLDFDRATPRAMAMYWI